MPERSRPREHYEDWYDVGYQAGIVSALGQRVDKIEAAIAGIEAKLSKMAVDIGKLVNGGGGNRQTGEMQKPAETAKSSGNGGWLSSLVKRPSFGVELLAGALLLFLAFLLLGGDAAIAVIKAIRGVP